MTFVNTQNFCHDASESLGVLLVNLGTPDDPSVASVRRYLAEFLADPRVVELPRVFWLPLLHGIILRTRPARSARAYREIWTHEGSPLLNIGQRQTAGLQARLNARIQGSVRVILAMRYGNPSIRAGLYVLRHANVRRLLVLPLYPQYSGSTTGSVFDAVTHELRRWRWLPEVRFINQYHDTPAYLDALADSIRFHGEREGQADRLLFSFHGIPRSYFDQGDPYFCQCHKTARLVAERLELDENRWALSFQSRFGRQEWLRPYTSDLLKSWGAAGIQSVQVIAPGFAADCLETLEEIAEENRHYFLDAGGKHYAYIPCLNDGDAHLELLTQLVMCHASGWPETMESPVSSEPLARRLERALALGAAG